MMTVIKAYLTQIWVADLTLGTVEDQLSLQKIFPNYWAEPTYSYVLDTTQEYSVFFNNQEAPRNAYRLASRIGPILKVFENPSDVKITGNFYTVSYAHQTARECSISIESGTEDITTLGDFEGHGFNIMARTLKSATISISGFFSTSPERDYYTLSDLFHDKHLIFLQIWIGGIQQGYPAIAEGIANVSVASSVDSVATMDLDITVNGITLLTV